MSEKAPENKKLDMKELENVAGGYHGNCRTVMVCRNCNHSEDWCGDYRSRGPYKCSRCYTDNLYGTDKYYNDDDDE